MNQTSVYNRNKLSRSLCPRLQRHSTYFNRNLKGFGLGIQRFDCYLHGEEVLQYSRKAQKPRESEEISTNSKTNSKEN